jgi:hypothetical protein
VREARYGERVVHPNVVRTLEIGEAALDGGGQPLHFLAIEWAGGELLERYAKRHCPLPPAEVARSSPASPPPCRPRTTRASCTATSSPTT